MVSCGLSAQTVTTTTVQGTVYQANGSPESGTVLVSWPAFTTAAGLQVAAGSTDWKAGALVMRPFAAIGDERYRLYLKVEG